jgi:hypothetical protein
MLGSSDTLAVDSPSFDQSSLSGDALGDSLSFKNDQETILDVSTSDTTDIPLEYHDFPLSSGNKREHFPVSDSSPLEFKRLSSHIKPNLGYFRGVTLPMCEFMWSVLIFVRFSWILSQTGLCLGLGLIGLCGGIVTGTATSIAAIATNGLPRDGVVPVLVRVLGAGMGGSIGFIFGIGVAIFAAVEVVGSIQGLLLIIPIHWTNETWDSRILSWICLITLFGVAYTGHRAVLR